MFAKDLGHSEDMDGRRALGKAFGDYVDSRGLTQTDVAAMGGPSTTSQTKIRMTDEPISRQTLQKVDLVMGWGHGTAARIIAGGKVHSGHRPIASYSNEEIADEVRRRLLLKEKPDDSADQKSASGYEPRITTDQEIPVTDEGPDASSPPDESRAAPPTGQGSRL